MKGLPDRELLQERFNYNPLTGTLSYRKDVSSVARTGQEAGSLCPDGYRTLGIGGTLYKTHRVIWTMMIGDIPPGMNIDHINGVRDDNRLENLRLVSPKDNHKNKKLRSDNTSGVQGIHWHRRDAKWRARLKVDGKNIHLGCFDKLEDAIKAKALVEKNYGFHPNHGRT